MCGGLAVSCVVGYGRPSCVVCGGLGSVWWARECVVGEYRLCEIMLKFSPKILFLDS